MKNYDRSFAMFNELVDTILDISDDDTDDGEILMACLMLLGEMTSATSPHNRGVVLNYLKTQFEESVKERTAQIEKEECWEDD